MIEISSTNGQMLTEEGGGLTVLQYCRQSILSGLSSGQGAQFPICLKVMKGLTICSTEKSYSQV